jgi:hypothetical protein
MGHKVYAIPVEQTGWQVADGSGTVQFSWEYDNNKEKLLNLYDKGKRRQWDAQKRIDWTLELDPMNPTGAVDEQVPIFGSEIWDKLGPKERGELRQHLAAWNFSQFLHGEQGALICASKIVQNVPEIDAKFYAATQVMDEARHVEVYSTLLNKIGLAYPINENLKGILNDVLTDSRWDMTYLGMQVLIEGLALAAFGLIRTFTENDLARSVTAYVMQDEARHVAFGRNVLKEYYPNLTQAERSEREEFCSEACYMMRDRFLATEVWETLGLPTDKCAEWMKNSESQLAFRSLLFMRIVPILKDITLWGPKMRDTFEKMGVIGYADTDLDAVMAEDEKIADEIDALRVAQVDETIAAGRDLA